MIVRSFIKTGYYIINNVIKDRNIFWNDCINFGIFIILFIGSMIHNEIFIINKYGLNTKTQLYLNNEFNNELTSIDDTSNDSEDNESKDKNEITLLD